LQHSLSVGDLYRPMAAMYARDIEAVPGEDRRWEYQSLPFVGDLGEPGSPEPGSPEGSPMRPSAAAPPRRVRRSAAAGVVAALLLSAAALVAWTRHRGALDLASQHGQAATDIELKAESFSPAVTMSQGYAVSPDVEVDPSTQFINYGTGMSGLTLGNEVYPTVEPEEQECVYIAGDYVYGTSEVLSLTQIGCEGASGGNTWHFKVDGSRITVDNGDTGEIIGTPGMYQIVWSNGFTYNQLQAAPAEYGGEAPAAYGGEAPAMQGPLPGNDAYDYGQDVPRPAVAPGPAAVASAPWMEQTEVEAAMPDPCEVAAQAAQFVAAGEDPDPCSYNLRGRAAEGFGSSPPSSSGPPSSSSPPSSSVPPSSSGPPSSSSTAWPERHLIRKQPHLAPQSSVAPSTIGSTMAASTPAPTSTSTISVTATSTSTITTQSATKTRTPSLYCFAVMAASGGERDLIVATLGGGVSIFACEQTAVLSSEELTLRHDNGKTFKTKDIGDMHCEYGGPYSLALNSEIFVRAWKRVLQDADYMLSDVTVKVDPDAVFFPSRLRRLLHKADGSANVYYNNCNHGLHGPIEVVSRGGMETFADGVLDCEEALSEEFKEWGEDVFLRHCLGYLKVDRVDEFHLLSEDHCFHEDPAHDGCTSGKVSFHPFKTIDGYFKCFGQALDSAP